MISLLEYRILGPKEHFGKTALFQALSMTLMPTGLKTSSQVNLK